MPRGVYDRTKGKGGSEKTETKKTTTKSAASSAPKAKKGGTVAVLPTADPGTQFAILRDNITALAHVRNTLSGSDAVAKQVEREIVQHVNTMTSLRQAVFGKTEAEKVAEGTSQVASVAGNGQGATVPLPTNPVNLPVPQA